MENIVVFELLKNQILNRNLSSLNPNTQSSKAKIEIRKVEGVLGREDLLLQKVIQ